WFRAGSRCQEGCPMSGFGLLVLLLVVVTPIAWFVSEFQDRRGLRLFFGVAAILLSFGVAFLAGSLERFNSNAWFGNATKKLIDATVRELEIGNKEQVLRALKRLQAEYSPAYENRASYDDLVEKAMREMQATQETAP